MSPTINVFNLREAVTHSLQWTGEFTQTHAGVVTDGLDGLIQGYAWAPDSPVVDLLHKTHFRQQGGRRREVRVVCE